MIMIVCHNVNMVLWNFMKIFPKSVNYIVKTLKKKMYLNGMQFKSIESHFEDCVRQIFYIIDI